MIEISPNGLPDSWNQVPAMKDTVEKIMTKEMTEVLGRVVEMHNRTVFI